MSTLAQIRTALHARIAAVPDVGIVHDRERYAKNEAHFRNLYLYTPTGGQPQIRGWWIRRQATLEKAIDIGPFGLQQHTWLVRGFMAFDDATASEIVFDELIEAIRDAIRADVTLGGVCSAGPLAADGEDGMQVDDVGPVMFAGALCHSVMLTFKTWSY
jgi:hypothetical protein